MSYTVLDIFEPVFVWNTLAKTPYTQDTMKELETAAAARESRLAEMKNEITSLSIQELNDGIQEMREDLYAEYLNVEVQQQIVEWLQCYEDRYTELMFPSFKDVVAVWK